MLRDENWSGSEAAPWALKAVFISALGTAAYTADTESAQTTGRAAETAGHKDSFRVAAETAIILGGLSAAPI